MLLLLLLVLLLILFPHVSFAESDLGETLTKFFNKFLGGILHGMEVIVGLFQFLFLEVIKHTILDFAGEWKDGALYSGFSIAWQILRDLVNLVIVVFFVLIAMITSFGEGSFGFHRKSLMHLIFAAALVNFSAFFTLLVIDISHIVFMLFFNALPLEGFGSLSPFSGYRQVLFEVGTPLLNFIVAIIAIVVNWFIILGILYFCIILIERYIIAMFLVLLSPLAVLGYFGGKAGGNALTKQLSGFYEKWKERLQYVFSTPVVLIVGFVLLLALFRGTLAHTVEPENFVRLLGIDNPEGREALLRLILGSIVLIFGIFKVGNVAKNANILGKGGIGKFKFGEFMKGRADAMARGRYIQGFLGNTVGRLPAGRDADGKERNINAWAKQTGWGMDRLFGKQGKGFSDPANKVANMVRGGGAVLKAFDSGKIYKNAGTVYRDFSKMYSDSFPKNLKDGDMGGWDRDKRERYNTLVETLADRTSNEEWRKRASTGQLDQYLNSQMRRMREFIETAPVNEGGGTSPVEEEGGGETTPTTDADISGGEGGDSGQPADRGGGDSDESGGGGSEPASDSQQSDVEDIEQELNEQREKMKRAREMNLPNRDAEWTKMKDLEKRLLSAKTAAANARGSGSGNKPNNQNNKTPQGNQIPQGNQEAKTSDTGGGGGTVSAGALDSLSQNELNQIKHNVTELRNSLQDRWGTEEAELKEKIADLEKKEGGATEEEKEDIEKQKADLEKKREQANKVNNDNEAVFKDKNSTDEQKKEVIKNSIEFAKNFVHEGTQNLDDNLKKIDDRLSLFNSTVPNERERNNNEDYKKLRDQRNRLVDQRKAVTKLESTINQVVDSGE